MMASHIRVARVDYFYFHKVHIQHLRALVLLAAVLSLYRQQDEEIAEVVN
tara:strand:- start:267 stop:416 length:150 start_codon:yes stop_codon:yes gene_type:complete